MGIYADPAVYGALARVAATMLDRVQEGAKVDDNDAYDVVWALRRYGPAAAHGGDPSHIVWINEAPTCCERGCVEVATHARCASDHDLVAVCKRHTDLEGWTYIDLDGELDP